MVRVSASPLVSCLFSLAQGFAPEPGPLPLSVLHVFGLSHRPLVRLTVGWLVLIGLFGEVAAMTDHSLVNRHWGVIGGQDDSPDGTCATIPYHTLTSRANNWQQQSI